MHYYALIQYREDQYRPDCISVIIRRMIYFNILRSFNDKGVNRSPYGVNRWLILINI